MYFDVEISFQTIQTNLKDMCCLDEKVGLSAKIMWSDYLAVQTTAAGSKGK